MIGNTICAGSYDYSDCSCSDGGPCPNRIPGSSCGVYGICGCNVVNRACDPQTCNDVQIATCCSPGTPVGPGTGTSTPTPTPAPTSTPAPSGGSGGGGGGGSGSCPVPGNPLFTAPTNGSDVNITTTKQITVSWSAAPNAHAYNVQVYPLGTPVGQECADPTKTYCLSNTSAIKFTFTLNQIEPTYVWRVQGVNTTCSPTTTGAWNTSTFNVVGNITGSFYVDNANQAIINGGWCQLPGAPLQGLSNVTSSITATTTDSLKTFTGNITGSGYALNNVLFDPNTQLTLSPDPTVWHCTCPVGCTYSGFSAPQSPVNFFISNVANAWWESSNGLLYAAASSGTALQSQVAKLCKNAPCSQAMSLENVANTPNSEGYAITGGGKIQSTQDFALPYSSLRQDATTPHIIGMKLNTPQENYAYFYQLYSMGQNPVTDFNGTKPFLPPSNGRAYFAGGDVTINSLWNVKSNESFVIFVNGNVTIANQIHVAEGGFLAFIVHGNITIDKTVGTVALASTATQVEGVYVADGRLITASNSTGDLKFVGGGTFVGWNGVMLNRQLLPRGLNNNTPAELFLFRPDFVFNSPPRMNRALQLWQETN